MTLSTADATLANLLEQMQRDPNTMNGWDIVLNLLVDPVDQLFRLVYDDQTPDPWQAVNVSYCQLLPNPLGAGQIVAYTSLQASLSKPALTFSSTQNVVEIAFTADGVLKQAGAIAPQSFDPAADCHPADPSLQWSTRQLTAEPFQAAVPLTHVTGTTPGSGTTFKTVLSFPAGTFRFPALANAPELSQLNVQLRNYFATTGVTYVVNEVQSGISGQIPALTPTSLRFNTLLTNSGKSILQFFITTTGSEQSNLTVNVNEPIPDGMQCNLMIRQEIAATLGPGLFQQASLFALNALVFPGQRTLNLLQQYSPHDTLLTGLIDLAANLAIVSGDGQQVVRSGDQPPGGIAAFAPLQVRASDVLGQPDPGVTVTFSPGTHPPMMATQLTPSGGSSVSVVAGPDGVATLDQMGGNSVNCYYDQGPFQIFATAEGGKTATFNLMVGPTPPPPVNPGATVSVVSGDGQHVARSGLDVPGGQANFAPLAVCVRDTNGQPLANTRVQWAAGTHPSQMAVQLDPSGADGKTTVTGPDGTATLNSMGGNSVTCYYAEGPFSIVASVAGGLTSATFNLTVDPTPPPPVIADANVYIVSGDGQHATRTGTSVPGGVANFAPLTVVVKSPDGTPMPGVPVNWVGAGSSGAMAVQLQPAGSSSQTTITAGDGTTTLAAMGGSSVTCYYADGSLTVAASCVGGQRGATFNLTVDPPLPPPPHPQAYLSVVSGDGQQAARTGGEVPGGTAMFAPMQVFVRDALGNPLPGIDVQWAGNGGGMAVQVDPSGGSPAVVTSDANGMSVLARMPGGRSVYCYYGTGSFTVTASVPGSDSATFHGTVTS